MPAAELAALSRIPEGVLVDKFALRGKHIAADDEHVSDCRSTRANRCWRRPESIRSRSTSSCTSGRCGRTTPSGRLRPGSRTASAPHAYAVEYDNVSCGTPVALRLARDMLVAEPELGTCCSSAPAASRTFWTTQRPLAVHVQLRRRRSRGAARQGRRPQRAARLARHHRRVALAPGEGSAGGSVHAERRLRVPGRRRSGGDEGAARRVEPRELRACGGGRARAVGPDAGRRLVAVRAAPKRSMPAGALEALGIVRCAPRNSTTRDT